MVFGPLVRTSCPSSVSFRSPLSSSSCTRVLANSPLLFSSCRRASCYSNAAMRSLDCPSLCSFSRLSASSSYFCSYCSFNSVCVLLLLLPDFKRCAPLPLLATDKVRVRNWSFRKHTRWPRLTRDVNWVSKRFCDGWIQLDHQASVFCEFFVSFLDQIVDPDWEAISHQSICHIHDERPGKACEITLVWKVASDTLVFFALVENRFNAQALVLRHVEHHYIFRFDN